MRRVRSHLGQSVSLPVSVGICAFNEEGRIRGMFESLLSQDVPAGVELEEILVVASGCTDRTEGTVEACAKIEPRIRLIREAERKGKVSALNLILKEYRGEILVLLNADARLRPGALEGILRPFLKNEAVEIACGRPVPETSAPSPRSLATELLWRIHNRTLETLSTLGLESHCCDEFVAIRRGFVEALPRDLINDGAYLGVVAALRHRPVRFCRDAEVLVETQGTLQGLVRLRRRTLWAHRQVTGMLARPSTTLRSLAKHNPAIAAKVLLGEFAAHPVSIPVFLLLALPIETIASLLARVDLLIGKPYQPAWPVVE